jgi:hypothetical protein
MNSMHTGLFAGIMLPCSYRTQCDHTIYRKNNQGMEQENRMSMKEKEKELGHS